VARNENNFHQLQRAIRFFRAFRWLVDARLVRPAPASRANFPLIHYATPNLNQ
jgi:hypothetical protein